MKRLLIASTLILISFQAVFAASEIMVDASGTPRMVSAKNPLPTVASGTTTTLIGSETIGLMTRLAAILSSLASDSYGLKIHDLGTATLPIQPGSSTIGLFWDAPLATPTVADFNSTSAPTVISPVAKQAGIILQNKAATESCYFEVGTVATPGYGTEIFAGGSIYRPYGDVTIAVVSTGTVPVHREQGVRP